MAREQELLLEEFTQFVGLLDGRTDLTIQHAKSWTMDELMTSIHPVRLLKHSLRASRVIAECTCQNDVCLDEWQNPTTFAGNTC